MIKFLCLQQGIHCVQVSMIDGFCFCFLQKLPISLSEKVSSMEFVTAAPEQPSPISVLDASFYQDDLPQYNLKNILNSPKG